LRNGKAIIKPIYSHHDGNFKPEEEPRVRWKVIWDSSKRGYTEQQVMKSLEKREDDSPAFIQPQRTYADMVIQFYRPEGKENEVRPGLNVRHILRPTLPHPDLTSLLEVLANKGITLDFVRHNDGKPVDILDIHGSIETPRAIKL
jgi:phosphoribulokinase